MLEWIWKQWMFQQPLITLNGYSYLIICVLSMTWKLSSKDKGSEYQSPMSLSEKQNEHPKYMLLAITNF